MAYYMHCLTVLQQGLKVTTEILVTRATLRVHIAINTETYETMILYPALCGFARPRHRLENNIKMDQKEMREGVDWVNLDQGRVHRWRL